MYLTPVYPGRSLVISQTPGSTALRQDARPQRYMQALVTPVTAFAAQTPLTHMALVRNPIKKTCSIAASNPWANQPSILLSNCISQLFSVFCELQYMLS